jgi:DNA-binding NarL/FixJ family response regulator
MTDPRYWRAIVALIDGQYAEADRLGAEIVRRSTMVGQPGNLASAWWVRAAVALWQENIDAAGEYAQRCTEAALAAGDEWDLAYCRNQQGHVATARRDYVEARYHYEAGYAIREALDDPEGMGTGLAHLAKVAALEGAWDEAEQLYQRSLAIARDIGDLVTMAWALNGLGRTACATGDVVAAGHHFAEGLRLMAEVRFMRHLLTFIASAGDWLVQTGRFAEATVPLALAQAHPAGDYETRTRARQSLAIAEAALPPETYAAAVERSQDIDPADLAVDLIPVLTAPLAAPTRSTQPAREDKAAQASSPSASPGPNMASTLVEPLTERELSVLRLIAAGRSNREIAEELFLAVNTVRSYSHQLYGKLGVGSRTQALARARELGLLT